VVSMSWDTQDRTYADQGATVHRIGELVLDVPGYEQSTYWLAYSHAVAAKTFDTFEFLVNRHKEGHLATDFKGRGPGKVAYQAPQPEGTQAISPQAAFLTSEYFQFGATGPDD